MTIQISLSQATYEKVLKCQKILATLSLNMTIVELALYFLRHHKEGREQKQ